MPSDIVIKGKRALDAVIARYSNNVANLTADIHAKDPTANIQSCTITSSVVTELVLNGAAYQAVQHLGGKTESEKVDIIAGYLDSPKVVQLNVSPDHYMVIFPIDESMVVILQGFQGTYSLVDYLENRGTGVIKKSELISEFRHLVGADQANRQNAAAKLFSFALAYEGKTATAAQQQVENDVRDWFTNPTRIGNIVVGNLP
jgi:hypothetical protein